jgi:hypothetical protein
LVGRHRRGRRRRAVVDRVCPASVPGVRAVVRGRSAARLRCAGGGPDGAGIGGVGGPLRGRHQPARRVSASRPAGTLPVGVRVGDTLNDRGSWGSGSCSGAIFRLRAPCSRSGGTMARRSFVMWGRRSARGGSPQRTGHLS